MTLAQIYNDYTVGSAGFCAAVETHCGYNISREEIGRIAAQAKTDEEFQNIWENDDSWTDAAN